MTRTITHLATQSSNVLGHTSQVMPHLVATIVTILGAMGLIAMTSTMTGCQQGMASHRVHVVDQDGQPLANTQLAVTFWQRTMRDVQPARTKTGHLGQASLRARAHSARTLFVSREDCGNFAIPYHLLPEQTDITITMSTRGFKPTVTGVDEKQIEVVNISTSQLHPSGVAIRSIIVPFDQAIPKYVEIESAEHFAGYAMQHDQSTNHDAIDPTLAAAMTPADPADAVAAKSLQDTPAIADALAASFPNQTTQENTTTHTPHAAEQIVTELQTTTATVPTDELDASDTFDTNAEWDWK